MSTVTEKQAQHTPGPWECVAYYDSPTTWVYLINHKKPQPPRSELEANSRLIEAAPEMLHEAIEPTVHVLKACLSELEKHHYPEPFLEQIRLSISANETAIRKARGRE